MNLKAGRYDNSDYERVQQLEIELKSVVEHEKKPLPDKICCGKKLPMFG